MAKDPRNTRVAIFGAGITGLSAAHELIVRGFQVEVIDPDINACIVPGLTLDRGIGGMARSQFVCDLFAPRTDDAMRRLWPAHDIPLDETIVFEPEAHAVPVDRARACEIVRRLGKTLLELKRQAVEINVLAIHTPVVPDLDRDPAQSGTAPSARERLDYVV